jgi:hypothetical protein
VAAARRVTTTPRRLNSFWRVVVSSSLRVAASVKQ